MTAVARHMPIKRYKDRKVKASVDTSN
jgi:hypothetical protein